MITPRGSPDYAPRVDETSSHPGHRSRILSKARDRARDLRARTPAGHEPCGSRTNIPKSRIREAERRPSRILSRKSLCPSFVSRRRSRSRPLPALRYHDGCLTRALGGPSMSRPYRSTFTLPFSSSSSRIVLTYRTGHRPLATLPSALFMSLRWLGAHWGPTRPGAAF